MNLEGLEKTDSIKEDGVPWDSMVGVRARGNWCEYETLGIYSVESHWGSVGERLRLEPVQLLSLPWRYPKGTESKDFLGELVCDEMVRL